MANLKHIGIGRQLIQQVTNTEKKDKHLGIQPKQQVVKQPVSKTPTKPQ